MLLEESKWIKKTLEKYFSERDFPMLNIGSSTGYFRKIVQPHIHNQVFCEITILNSEVQNFCPHFDFSE